MALLARVAVPLTLASTVLVFSHAAEASKDNDTLVFASDSEPENISPYHTGLREGVVLGRLAWDTLIYRDPRSGQYQPMLATDWSWEDSTHLLIHLRRGVSFHNGDGFSADDVVFTFNYILSPESKAVSRQNTDWMDHVEKVDDYSVRIVLKKPFPAAFEYLAGPTPIFPARYFKQVGLEGFSKAPVGTGPYVITKVISGQGVHLQRNDHYFADSPIPKPAISKIEFVVIPDADTRIAQLMTGAVDWIWRVPSDQAESMQAMPNLTVTGGETMRIGYLAMDSQGTSAADSPFKDLRVRQAVDYAINRDGMARELVRGGSRALYAPCYPSQFGCDLNAAVQYAYDPEKARSLLQQAGYADGFDTEIYAYRDRDLVEAVIGDLRKVGIRARLHFETFAALRNDQRAGKVPLAFQSWGSGAINDVSAIISAFFKGGADDIAKDADLLSWLSTADTSMDDKVRQENYSKAIQRITEQAYWAPLVTYSTNYAFSSDLNFTAYPDELPRFYEASWK
ncbi:ABC transporter substrate-binding protein [Pokkaliibacter sp. MBI-7]|uniref:ABC transporter substrate-binding protein n=1 Tax=Pokkaliibacter sp. MBI-7 TaxID=3040600 RepID=UPI0024477B4D|nr:ABC transporter substrate-binding protein [Pokkaliibacter sp. MBI-7]MDH2434452.1 ABC transporter substrate-binding protein [Pokkaliibacter sp. MBI-7]